MRRGKNEKCLLNIHLLGIIWFCAVHLFTLKVTASSTHQTQFDLQEEGAPVPTSVLEAETLLARRVVQAQVRVLQRLIRTQAMFQGVTQLERVTQVLTAETPHSSEFSRGTVPQHRTLRLKNECRSRKFQFESSSSAPFLVSWLDQIYTWQREKLTRKTSSWTRGLLKHKTCRLNTNRKRHFINFYTSTK